ncbi:MAG: hypothetical protein ACRYG8_25585 [Janthinobacterium lividum]
MATESTTTLGTRRAVTAPSRRQFGASALAAACGAAFAVAVVLPNPGEAFPAIDSPDAHLLALCAEAMRLDQAADVPGIGLADCTALLNTWQEVADQIAATPARTPAGREAKGGIIRHLMTPASVRPDNDEAKWDDACVYGPLVWSLVNDLAAVA